jgi:N6-adenosine-specific RNA methylase IME4
MRYRTIVADPPWAHGRTGIGFGRNGNSKSWEPGPIRTTDVPFGTLCVDEVKAIPVVEIAEDDAHLYLWTTQRFLVAAYDVARAWGFEPSYSLVWCKEPRGFNMGGTYASTVEFCVFARRGSCPAKTRVQRQWFTWPRPGVSAKYGQAGQAKHSAKPEAFLDLVEQVSPGPYVELFARRARFGWDYWGDESLGTATMGEGRGDGNRRAGRAAS